MYLSFFPTPKLYLYMHPHYSVQLGASVNPKYFGLKEKYKMWSFESDYTICVTVEFHYPSEIGKETWNIVFQIFSNWKFKSSLDRITKVRSYSTVQ